MTRPLARLNAYVIAGALACGALTTAVHVRAQVRTSGGSTSVAVISPAVVASWRTFDNHAGVSTSLLVLWRGAPGWFGNAIAPSSGNSGPTNQTFTYADREFRIDYDDSAATATILKRQLSLKDVNVVLVDGVDSAAGATIFASRWVPPGPPAPPLTPGAIGDPIAGVLLRAPALYEYLRCDLMVSNSTMQMIMPMLCGRMRGELVLSAGYPR